MKNRITWFTASLMAVFMASCGNDGDDNPAYVPEVISNPVTGIALDTELVSLSGVGQTARVSVTASPSNAGDLDRVGYKFISGNPKVFTVDESGTITATGPGETLLNVVAANNAALTATCKVVVTGKPVTSIRIAASRKVIDLSRNLTVALNPAASAANKTAQIEVSTQLFGDVTVEPADADNKVLRWTSSNTDVAPVYDGQVFAKNYGRAVIRVEATDGSGVYDECTVNVYHWNYVELDRSDWTITSSPTTTFTPDGTTDVYGGPAENLIDDNMGSVCGLLKIAATGGPSSADGIHFILDLGSPQKFNTIRWEGGWRNGTNTNNNTKVSNIANTKGRNSETDEWTSITTSNMTINGSYYSTYVPMINGGTHTYTTSNPTTAVPVQEYRYLRVQLTASNTTTNNGNIGVLWNDFKLFLYKRFGPED